MIRKHPFCKLFEATFVVCFSVLGFSLPLVAGDWPHFLGPNYDFHSAETGLLDSFPPEGPKKLWEHERGKGHAPPVVSGDFLVLIHQKDKREIVECLDAATGKPRWKHDYAVKVDQNFGITDAPRSSPVIDPESKLVFTLGNDGDLIAFNLEDGKIEWQLNLRKSFGDAPFFFGQGSCPLVFGDLLIVHAGSPGACVVGLEKKTGELRWKTPHQWNGSYASPVPAKVNGEDRIYVLAGGMVKPPHGGLLCVNPKDGKIDDAIPWRSDMFASVLAASPVPCGDNRVFITEDYGKGGAMIEFDAEFKGRIVWQSLDLNCQFQTPIYHDGALYGFGGSGGLLICYDAAYGRPLWSETFLRLTIPWDGRELPVNMGRGNLIYADGAFLCLGENGTLLRLAMSADSRASVLSKAQLFYAPETWAAPVLSNGRLYINQSEMGSRLICYDLKNAAE